MAAELWPASESQLVAMAARLRREPHCLTAAQLDGVAGLVPPPPPPDQAAGRDGVVTAAVRCLRTAAAVSEIYRRHLASDAALVRRVSALLCRPQLQLVQARCAVQLLSNLLPAGQQVQHTVWAAVGDHLLSLLATDDDKLAAYTAAMLYNAIRENGDAVAGLLVRDDFGSIASQLLRLVAHHSEFALFCVESLCAADFVRVYEVTGTAERALLLDVALVAAESGRLTLPEHSVQWLAERLRPHLTLPPADGAVVELKKQLELLGVLSADERLRPALQRDDSLLQSVVTLLTHVHQLNKTDGTAFTTLSQLAELERRDGHQVTSEPAFGLKAHLVRLLGNLVWRRPVAQQAARRLGAIPVVLECCNLDARNPLLQQWAVVAVRHLCERCPENQSEISGLTLQGLAPAAADELSRLGLTTVTEAGRLRVRSQPHD